MNLLCANFFFQKYFKMDFVIHKLFFTFSDVYFKIYDVYNNAWNLGGQLNVSFEQYLVVQRDGAHSLIGDSIPAKYFKRSKMTDIFLRVGFVVTNCYMIELTIFFHQLFICNDFIVHF